MYCQSPGPGRCSSFGCNPPGALPWACARGEHPGVAIARQVAEAQENARRGRRTHASGARTDEGDQPKGAKATAKVRARRAAQRNGGNELQEEWGDWTWGQSTGTRPFSLQIPIQCGVRQRAWKHVSHCGGRGMSLPGRPLPRGPP